MKAKLFLSIIVVVAIAAGVWIWTAQRSGEVNVNLPKTTTNSNVSATNQVTPIVLLFVEPNRGSTAGGTEVTLIGEGFSTGLTVSFGEKAATDVTVVDDKTVKAKTPPNNAGAVDVRAVSTDGRTALSTSAFTYE